MVSGKDVSAYFKKRHYDENGKPLRLKRYLEQITAATGETTKPHTGDVSNLEKFLESTIFKGKVLRVKDSDVFSGPQCILSADKLLEKDFGRFQYEDWCHAMERVLKNVNPGKSVQRRKDYRIVMNYDGGVLIGVNERFPCSLAANSKTLNLTRTSALSRFEA
jgi:hypothetical protein